MTYAPLVYVGDGTTTDFAVTWGKLANEDVDVTVGGSAAVFTWLSSGLIKITPAPTAATIVKIARSTNSTARAVIFPNATSLTADMLNKSAEQLFFLAEEANAVAAEALHLNAEDSYDAGGKRVVNIADPVNGNDAATLGFIENRFAGDVAQVAADRAAASTSATNSSTSANASAGSAAASQTSRLAADGAAAAAAADRVQTGLDRTAVAADRNAVATNKTAVDLAKVSVDTQKGLVDTAKAAVDTQKGLVDAAKASVDNTKTLVDAAKAAADADVVLTHADVLLTHADVVLADNARIAAEAAAASTTPVAEQINAATDEAFADDAMLVARKADGSLIKRSWANTKAALKSYFDSLYALVGHSHAFSALSGKPTTLGGYGITDALAAASVATAANYRAKTAAKVLNTDGVWEANQWVDLGSTLNGNLSLDFATFINGFGTATGNIVFNGVSNLKDMTGSLSITTAADYTVGLNTTYFRSPGALTLKTGRNLFSFIRDADGKVMILQVSKGTA